MKRFSASGRASCRLVVAAGLALAATGAAALELTAEEVAGKRLYGEGRGLSGGPVAARIGVADIAIDGAPVACGNCHGADGRGRPEGVVRPPDITWRELTKPYGHEHGNGRRHPAFDERSVAAAVRRGIDPAGNRLDSAMPRYVLSDAELAALVAYLKRLEFDRDPGIGDAVLRIGTLLPRQGPWAEAGQAVEAVLRAQLELLNAGGGVHGRRLELVVAALPERLPDARERVRELAREDLFALLSPFAPGVEAELAAAADVAGVPVVGPVTPAGDEGRGGRTVFQVLPGLVEQGRALARFAVQGLGLTQGEVSVVSADAPAMAAAAAAVEAELQRLGGPRVVHHAYPAAAFNAGQALGRLREHELAAVFFFGGDADFAAFARDAAASGRSPYLLAAAGQVARAALGAPRGFAGRVFLASPLLPGDGSAAGRAALAELQRRAGASPAHQPLQRAAYAAAAVLVEAIKRAGRDTSRTKLVEALENLYDFDTGVTPPITFGPGRRVGAAGAHIVAADLEGQGFRPVRSYFRLD